jgi:hypothetical protein
MLSLLRMLSLTLKLTVDILEETVTENNTSVSSSDIVNVDVVDLIDKGVTVTENSTSVSSSDHGEEEGGRCFRGSAGNIFV